MMPKMILKIILVLLAAVVFCFIVFLSVGLITDFRPEDRQEAELLYSGGSRSPLPDSLKIMSWNIGYGGLGDNMDFFYDGGKKVRDSKERTMENLLSAIETIRSENPDIVLLQEVDRNSKRTYGIDETALLAEAFPEYSLYFAYNYKSFYVPIPLKEPVGRVGSGLLVMTRNEPDEAIRYQYPSGFPFPVSMFNLKRCLLTLRFTLADGTQLVVGNTHNTAYDTGGMRSEETAFLAGLLSEYAGKGYKTVIGGDWNQYPAAYVPSPAETTDGHFSTIRLEEEKLSPYGRIGYAGNDCKTLRHLDRVLDENSVLTVTDYFFLSDSLDSSEVRMLPLDFRNSDHNPVVIGIRIQ